MQKNISAKGKSFLRSFAGGTIFLSCDNTMEEASDKTVAHEALVMNWIQKIRQTSCVSVFVNLRVFFTPCDLDQVRDP